MNKRVTVMLLFFLVTASYLFMPLPAIAQPKTITVPDDYPTITDAVGNATAGDTIFVKSGVYTDNLVINKPLTLKGQNKETTTIICKDKEQPTILVEQNRVNITGFTIKNAVTATSGSRTKQSALHLLHASFCNIYENLLIKGGYGIWLYGSNNNSISHNSLSENNYGIVLESCSDNIVVQNTVSNCWTGICLDANGNVLKNNNLLNNDYNLRIGCHYNDIDTSNLVNGKEVVYLVNQKNVEIDSLLFPDVGFLALINCTSITVKDLNLTGNYEGLIVFDTSNSTISNNNVYDNSLGISIQNSFDITINGNNVFNHPIGSGISVKNSYNFTIFENNLTTDWIGVKVWHSHNCSIIGNQIVNMEFEGIENLGSENITIADNLIKDNEVGFYHRTTYPSYSYPTDEVISNNQIIANWRYAMDGFVNNSSITNNCLRDNGSGIRAGTNCIVAGNNITQNSGVGLWAISNNLIKSNHVAKNEIGIGTGGSENTIIENIIIENEKGIYFFDSAENNLIYHNNLVNNEVQFYNKDSNASNTWNNNHEGNYWSNYNGTDVDGDGIGDTPYVIDEKNQDNYPLMAPYEAPPTPSPEPTPEINSFSTSLILIASGIAAAVVGVSLLVYFKKRRAKSEG